MAKGSNVGRRDQRSKLAVMLLLEARRRTAEIFSGEKKWRNTPACGWKAVSTTKSANNNHRKKSLDFQEHPLSKQEVVGSNLTGDLQTSI